MLSKILFLQKRTWWCKFLQSFKIGMMPCLFVLSLLIGPKLLLGRILSLWLSKLMAKSLLTPHLVVVAIKKARNNNIDKKKKVKKGENKDKWDSSKISKECEYSYFGKSVQACFEKK